MWGGKRSVREREGEIVGGGHTRDGGTDNKVEGLGNFSSVLKGRGENDLDASLGLRVTTEQLVDQSSRDVHCGTELAESHHVGHLRRIRASALLRVRRWGRMSGMSRWKILQIGERTATTSSSDTRTTARMTFPITGSVFPTTGAVGNEESLLFDFVEDYVGV